MNIGKACAIFDQIQSDKFTEEEKGIAIYQVLKMPTHNSITKDNILKVTQYLFDLHYDVEESEKHGN